MHSISCYEYDFLSNKRSRLQSWNYAMSEGLFVSRLWTKKFCGITG